MRSIRASRMTKWGLALAAGLAPFAGPVAGEEAPAPPPAGPEARTPETTPPAPQPAPEAAAETTPSDTELRQPIVVTATRREMLLSDVPDVLRVVTRAEIEALKPSSLGEVFESVAGASVETGTGSGLPKRSVIGLNGLPASYTLVLVDGVRLLTEHMHTGQNLELIPAQDIEQIEIIRGAASAQYGADAIGGVVNIITRRCGPEPETTLGAAVGSYHTYEGGVTVLQPVDRDVRIAASLYREQSDGAPVEAPPHRVGNMGYERFGARVRVDADLSETTRAFGWASGMDVTSDWRDADTDSYQVMAALGGEQRIAPDLALAAQYAYSKWHAEASHERHELHQPEAHVAWDLHPDHTLTAGGDVRYYRFERTAVDDIPSQEAYGVFVQHEWRVLGNLTLMGALRLDDVEEVDPALSPKVTVLYEPHERVRLHASVSRGFHAPTLQELYEEGYGHGGTALRFGNPDLDPEFSWTYAAGADLFPLDPLDLLLYGHYSDLDDMIVPVYEGPWSVDPTKDVWRRTNIEHARVYGFEVAARYTACPFFRLEAGYTWTAQKDTDTGRQLPYDPGSAFYLKAMSPWAVAPGWTVTGFLGLRVVRGRSAWNWKPSASAPVGDPSGLITELEDFEKLDAGIDVQQGERLSIYLKAYNLLQQDLEYLDDAYTVVDGEVAFKVGLRWRF